MTEERLSQSCAYRGPAGHSCDEDAGTSGLCRWHDPNIKKTGPGDRAALEALARSGRSMEGFSLRDADLRGIDLADRDGADGLNLSYADLSHANLSDAHLFHLNLRGSTLLKADFSGANLNKADVRDADLLGMKLQGARIEHIRWGEDILQKRQAYAAMRGGEGERARDCFEQAEEIYRNLRKAAEGRGQFENAGGFFHHEMVMRRHQIPFWTARRFLSKLVDVFCGYGEAPIRVVSFSVLFILVCSVFYFFLHVGSNGQEIGYDPSAGFASNLHAFGNCFYFSIVTFTTLGYGDIVPFGWARPVAAFEAFCGAFTLALFVVVFVKKMTR